MRAAGRLQDVSQAGSMGLRLIASCLVAEGLCSKISVLLPGFSSMWFLF